MLEFIANNLYLVLIIVCIFMYLYYMGGEDIIFFRKKKYNVDPKADENLSKVLNRFVRTRDFKLLDRTTVKFEETQLTFDAILLTYYGVIGFVNDGHGGQIYGDENSDDWTQIFEENKIHFSNPTKPYKVTNRLFKDIFRREKTKNGNVDVMFVFSNRVVSVAVPKSMPVCTVKDLKEKLTSSKYMSDCGADIEAMEAAIKKYTVE